MFALKTHNLRVRYSPNGPEILKGIDIELKDNDFLAIIGPSGAGKSTLIRSINRLVEPSDGSIELLGHNVCALSPRGLRHLRRDVGMIFQEFNLINRMSVMDNVLSGRLGYTNTLRSIFRHFRKADIERALVLLDRVGLSDQVDKRADQLSGGQRQRVGIARALMQEPKLLLLDEPTSALDPKIAREIMTLIREVAQELHLPAICNIHNVQLAQEFCNRIVGLQDGVKKFDGETAALQDKDLEVIYNMEIL